MLIFLSANKLFGIILTVQDEAFVNKMVFCLVVIQIFLGMNVLYTYASEKENVWFSVISLVVYTKPYLLLEIFIIT